VVYHFLTSSPPLSQFHCDANHHPASVHTHGFTEGKKIANNLALNRGNGTSNPETSITTRPNTNCASSSAQRKDKQIMTDPDAEGPIIVNMARARAMSQAWLLDVSVFLSVITITSKNLISYMCNIWKVRGTMLTN
jgi:hypothetical protein